MYKTFQYNYGFIILNLIRHVIKHKYIIHFVLGHVNSKLVYSYRFSIHVII